jgi:hemoglobin-like flavoprotein
MTPEQKILVQKSFEKVQSIADVAAQLFYNRLFELDPSLRHLFKGDMKEQGQKLMNMLQIAVRGLDRLEQLVPAVSALGQRHATYNVRPEHYTTVGTALIWTLEQGLGVDFTPETREAWLAVYKVLTNVMKSAATSRAA